MLEFIKQIFTSPEGSFGSAVAFVLFCFWAVHWITKKITIICTEHGVLTGNTVKMEGNIDDIRRDLAYLKGSFDLLKPGTQNTLMQRKSPISLTDKGKTVATDIKAEEILSKNWEKILDILNKEIADKNAYDIQQYCIESLSVEPAKFLDKESLLSLKNYAFNQGEPLQLYTRLLGIVLRDRYLKYKKIPVEEVDKYDPEAKG